MSPRIAGVGIGVFVIVTGWISAIAAAIFLSRTKRPTSLLGIVGIAVAFLVTVVLLCIPRGERVPGPPSVTLEQDTFFIWRTTVLAFLVLSAIVGFVVLVTDEWAAVRNAVVIGTKSQGIFVAKSR